LIDYITSNEKYFIFIHDENKKKRELEKALNKQQCSRSGHWWIIEWQYFPTQPINPFRSAIKTSDYNQYNSHQSKQEIDHNQRYLNDDKNICRDNLIELTPSGEHIG
jgi:hypothetical protein